MPKSLDGLNGGQPTRVVTPPDLSSLTPNLSDPRFTGTAPAVMTPTTTMAVSSVPRPAKMLALPDIVKYGQAENGNITATADKLNKMATLADMDEVGKVFARAMMVTKGYDPDNLMKGGLFGMIKANIEKVRLRYESANTAMVHAVADIDKQIALFIQQLGDIKQMKIDNEATQANLVKIVAELIQAADWMDANVPELDPNDSNSASRRQEWKTVADFARKRADDLQRGKINCEQQHALLDITANNAALMAMKFGIVKEVVVPALKNGFAMAVINDAQAKGAKIADTWDATANDILQKNAKMIGQNTTAINTTFARSSINIETLQVQHTAIVSALDEVDRIRAEMRTRLTTEAPQIMQLSQDLTKRLGQ